MLYKNVFQYKLKIHIPLVFTKTKLNPYRLQVGKYAYRLYTLYTCHSIVIVYSNKGI